MLFSLNYSLCGILKVQLFTSLGAILGTLLGSYLGNLYMRQCLAFTSGGFLYFAINGLLGELKSVNSLFELVNCVMAIGMGLYCMYLFALFE